MFKTRQCTCISLVNTFIKLLYNTSLLTTTITAMPLPLHLSPRQDLTYEIIYQHENSPPPKIKDADLCDKPYYHCRGGSDAKILFPIGSWSISKDAIGKLLGGRNTQDFRSLRKAGRHGRRKVFAMLQREKS